MIVKIIAQIIRLFGESKGYVQGVEKKVAQLDTEVDQVKAHSDKNDAHLRKVDGDLKRQIAANDTDISHIRNHLKSVEGKLAQVDAENDARIKQVQKRFQSVIDVTEINADDIKESIDLLKKLDKENDGIGGMLAKLNKEFDAHEEDIAKAYEEIKKFKF